VRGLLLPAPVLVLAQLVLGALIEAALLITYAADPRARRRRARVWGYCRVGFGWYEWKAMGLRKGKVCGVRLVRECQ
jgi:hypothetical protein